MQGTILKLDVSSHRNTGLSISPTDIRRAFSCVPSAVFNFAITLDPKGLLISVWSNEMYDSSERLRCQSLPPKWRAIFVIDPIASGEIGFKPERLER